MPTNTGIITIDRSFIKGAMMEQVKESLRNGDLNPTYFKALTEEDLEKAWREGYEAGYEDGKNDV